LSDSLCVFQVLSKFKRDEPEVLFCEYLRSSVTSGQIGFSFLADERCNKQARVARNNWNFEGAFESIWNNCRTVSIRSISTGALSSLTTRHLPISFGFGPLFKTVSTVRFALCYFQFTFARSRRRRLPSSRVYRRLPSSSVCVFVQTNGKTSQITWHAAFSRSFAQLLFRQ
jgi:hypothetical protein